MTSKIFSENYLKAVESPYQQLLSTVSKEFIGRTFEELKGEEKEKIIRENGWALIARSIASFLSDLKPEDGSEKRSFDFFGTIVNAAGHALNASILKYLKVKGAEDYIQRTYDTMREIFQIIQENQSKPLKESDFILNLRSLDVPNNFEGRPVAVTSKEKNESVKEQFAVIFKTGFSPKIITRNETLTGTSLRAMANPEAAAKLITMVKTLVEESGLVDTMKDFKIEEFVSMMLEGYEIADYVKSNAKTYNPNEEDNRKLGDNKSSQALKEYATTLLFNKIKEAMKQVAKENPTLDFTPFELVMYPSQCFYPRGGGVKHVIDEKPINEIRQKVCPGIAPIKYPRITYLGIPTKPLSPIDTKESTLLKVLQQVQSHVQDPCLGSLINFLDREITIVKKNRECQLALSFFEEMSNGK